ncbi:MAG: pilus assembly protein PilP [Gammaproteobacteria bacterium]
MKSMKKMLNAPLVMTALLAMLLAGCGGDMDDLLEYVDEVKSRPGGRIEPLPQIKPYQSFDYSADTMRSPFLPDAAPARSAASGPTPIVNRPKEYLEGFPLDTLAMVGTLEREGRTFGLVQTQDGLVHRVLPGNFVGQNDGRVVGVTGAGIQVEELVPDGIGGFFKRSAAISLD